MRRLLELRALRGWTQSDLASKAGVSQSVVSDMEKRPDANYSVRSMKKVADALEVTVLDIAEFSIRLGSGGLPGNESRQQASEAGGLLAAV